MRTATRLLAAVVLMAASLLPWEPALACTCARGPAREAMQYSDAAFIGSIVKSDPFPGKHVIFDIVYTFRVKESFKRDLGYEVRVASSSGGDATCGVYTLEGEQAYFLEEYEPGRYGASSCSSVEPDLLRRAARPLPVPDERGRQAFLLGGAFGEVRTIALDSSGRTLGYGSGEGWINELIACPGGRRVVELISRDKGDIGMAIRELPSLRVREIPLPAGIDANDSLSLSCLDWEGRDLALFWSNHPYGKREGSILRLQGEEWRRVEAGSNVGFANFIGPTAYLTTIGRSPRLIALDVRTGLRRTIARVPSQSRSWIRSPDGRRFAGFSQPSNHPPRLVVVDLHEDPPSVTVRRVYVESWEFTAIHWLDSDRLAFLPFWNGRLRIFDPSLRLLEKWEQPWQSSHPIISGDRVYGILHDPDRMASVRLEDGRGQQVIGRELEEGVSTVLILPTRPVTSRASRGHEGIQWTLAKQGWILGLLLVGILAGAWMLWRRRGQQDDSSALR